MKVVFVYGKKPSSILTKIFTDSTCYHVGFTDGVKFWDMHKIRRRREWPLYEEGKFICIECPVNVTSTYLDYMLDVDNSEYGKIDYLLFALRPIYHFFGLSTRNFGGTICSEMVANDLRACGWNHYFLEVPSPADLELSLLGKVNAINKKN